MALDPERSGWENPDGHKSIQQRGRPMFDPDGRPVTSAPEPEPLTPAERAMFGGQDVRPVIDPTAHQVPVLSHEVHVAATEAMTMGAKLDQIHALAAAALDNPSPAAWAVALDRIVGLTK
jgi:hypothetical protein